MINENNPLQPFGAQTVDVQMGNYRQRYQQLVSSLSEQPSIVAETVRSPFLPSKSESQSAQDKRRSDIQAWLAPIDRPDPQRSPEYHSKRMDNMMLHSQKDPAMSKIMPVIEQMLPAYLEKIKGGSLTKDDAMKDFAHFAESNFLPLIQKHHGKDSASYNVSMLSDHETELPELMKGGK